MLSRRTPGEDMKYTERAYSYKIHCNSTQFLIKLNTQPLCLGKKLWLLNRESTFPFNYILLAACQLNSQPLQQSPLHPTLHQCALTFE